MCVSVHNGRNGITSFFIRMRKTKITLDNMRTNKQIMLLQQDVVVLVFLLLSQNDQDDQNDAWNLQSLQTWHSHFFPSSQWSSALTVPSSAVRSWDLNRKQFWQRRDIIITILIRDWEIVTFLALTSYNPCFMCHEIAHISTCKKMLQLVWFCTTLLYQTSFSSYMRWLVRVSLYHKVSYLEIWVASMTHTAEDMSVREKEKPEFSMKIDDREERWESSRQAKKKCHARLVFLTQHFVFMLFVF